MKRFLTHCRKKGFTLLELLTVVAIIIVLAGLILSGMGYAQQKAASERARAEISALSLALESYKIDNGDYPRTIPPDDTAVTDGLSVNTGTASAVGAKVLYRALSGVASGTAGVSEKVYFSFKGDMLSTGTNAATADTHVIDPFGYAYGYSTLANKKYSDGDTPAANTGFNPTFDLWSTGGQTKNDAPSKAKWITNW